MTVYDLLGLGWDFWTSGTDCNASGAWDVVRTAINVLWWHRLSTVRKNDLHLDCSGAVRRGRTRASTAVRGIIFSFFLST